MGILCTYMNECVYIYVGMSVCIYVYMCVLYECTDVCVCV